MQEVTRPLIGMRSDARGLHNCSANEIGRPRGLPVSS